MKVTDVTYQLRSVRHGRFEVEYNLNNRDGKPMVFVSGPGTGNSGWSQKTPGPAAGNFRPNKTSALYWARLLIKEMKL